MVISSQAWAGTWTTNGFIYKPALGARGTSEKETYDTGQDRVDARLGKEIWVGDPNYGTTLQDAVTAIGSNPATLRVPAGTYDITSNLTIPANICLRVERGAVFSVGDGVTFTINGPFSAGLYQVFSCAGTGKVVFGSGAVKDAFPQWWGAKGDGTTNDYTAINAVCNSGALKVTFIDTGSNYIVNNCINLPSNLVINLQGHATIHQSDTTGDASHSIVPIFNLVGDVHDITIKGGVLEGTCTSGVNPNYVSGLRGLINYNGGNNPYNITIDGVEVRYSLCCGMEFIGLTSTGIKIINCHVHHNASFGIGAPCGDIVIEECEINDNQYAGIDCGGDWTYGTLKILNNDIYRNGAVNGGGTQDYGSWCGILLFGTQRVLIKGNFIHDNGCQGIFATGHMNAAGTSFIAPSNIQIIGNKIYDHTSTANGTWNPAGIFICGGNDFVIAKNIAWNNYENYGFRATWNQFPALPINLTSLTVVGNISRLATSYGYVFKRGGNISVDANAVSNCGIFRGGVISDNISDSDANAYSLQTGQGLIWGKNNVTIPAADTLGSELLTNGDFETGDPPSNWTVWNSGTLAQVTANRPGSAGTKSLSVTTTSAWGGAYQGSIAVTAGHTYFISMWCYKVSGTGTLPSLVLTDGGGWYLVIGGDNDTYLPLSTWKEYTGYFVAPSTESINIKLKNASSAGVVYFDDVSMKEVTNAPSIGDLP